MNILPRYGFAPALFLISLHSALAGYIAADPASYKGYLGSLAPGDTLYLSPGTYTGNLTLNGRKGTPSEPKVITGSGEKTVFQAQSCCNTDSITQSSYLVISNLQLDGMNLAVDGVKAEGTAGNWAHHITIERLNIVNYGSDQQNVGISTKCSAWNWIIRSNRIIGAGTGMYLGNSSGDDPFVNGVIENNYVANTLGYNIEVKHQLAGTRDAFPGTAVDGRTIIRHIVFTKDAGSATGSWARANLLVGGFPPSGWGTKDYYEIYGNFFYQNPTEALFQGTGNIILYDNIFVNHFDPSGFRAVYITSQNGVQPQDIRVFHNTLWAHYSSGGIRLYNPSSGYRQYCYGNALFSPSPVSNFTDTADNVTGDYAGIGANVISASTDINALDLYPLSGRLTGASTPSGLFESFTDWEKDFNGRGYDWGYRGAYSGCCINDGWRLRLDTMPAAPSEPSSSVSPADVQPNQVAVYPNPFVTTFRICTDDAKPYGITICNLLGEEVYESAVVGSQVEIDVSDIPSGIYLLHVRTSLEIVVMRVMKRP
jgi:hypothetical protein